MTAEQLTLKAKGIIFGRFIPQFVIQKTNGKTVFGSEWDEEHSIEPYNDGARITLLLSGDTGLAQEVWGLNTQQVLELLKDDKPGGDSTEDPIVPLNNELNAYLGLTQASLVKVSGTGTLTIVIAFDEVSNGLELALRTLLPHAPSMTEVPQ